MINKVHVFMSRYRIRLLLPKYDGLDPEISGSGVDNNIYPRPRVFMLGLNLNF